MNENINELFGDLRSMLTSSDPDPRELFWLLESAYAEEPGIYEAQWHPYLRSYAPIELLITSIEELDALTKLLPEGSEQAVTLSMVGHHLRAWNFAHIADAPGALFLSTLDISDNKAQNHYPSAFAHSKTLVNLRTLRMADCDLHEFVATWILRSPFLATVEELDLSGNPLLTADVEALAETEHIGNVRRLGLARCGLNDDALNAIISSERFEHLEALDLGENTFSQKAFLTFAAWPQLAELTSFVLPWGDITLKTREKMLKSPYLTESAKDFLFAKTIPKKKRKR